MADTKTKSNKLTHKEKQAAKAAANRRAQMQWWVLGAVLVAATIATIVLISVFTEGSLPTQHGG